MDFFKTELMTLCETLAKLQQRVGVDVNIHNIVFNSLIPNLINIAISALDVMTKEIEYLLSDSKLWCKWIQYNQLDTWWCRFHNT